VINLYKSNEILKEKKSVKVEKASPHFAERLLNILSHTVNSIGQKSCPLKKSIPCLDKIHGVACTVEFYLQNEQK
jgi:hypothetical protein